MTWGFRIGSLAAWLAVVLVARAIRGRLYATFVGVMLGIYTMLVFGLAPLLTHAVHGRFVVPALGVPAPLVWLHAVVYAHFLLLARPRLRPLLFRALVSIPASFFLAGSMLAFPWAIAGAVGFPLPGVAVPYAIALLGLVQSLVARETEIDLVLEPAHVEGLRPHAPPEHRASRPLSIVQISDPHLGPFMSVARLRRICERAVARNPDLIVLTGDFLTMESQTDPRHLRDALSPLRAAEGKVFACFGNHDHEAPEIVRGALRENGVRLLVDEATVVETDAGPVQIVGMDYHFKERERRMAAVCAKHPRIEGHMRLVLLHDPWAFKHLPSGEGDLVLSGHTHGGQVGLLSLGASWTFLRLFGESLPDHGFWARGTDRLYVHRGTGHYGFPLRLGVPSEESLLKVHRLPT